MASSAQLRLVVHVRWNANLLTGRASSISSPRIHQLLVRSLSSSKESLSPTHSAILSEQIPSPSQQSQQSLKRSSATKAYADLAKAKLSTLVVTTTACGFLAAGGPFSAQLGLFSSCIVGTALCSSSAAAWNQIFEVDRDKLMKRTQQRPLVDGTLTIGQAQTAATLWGVGGISLLAYGTDPVTTMLGASNIVLYSGIYTFMKPRSIYNTWVGAVVGAIPPGKEISFIFCSKVFHDKIVFCPISHTFWLQNLDCLSKQNYVALLLNSVVMGWTAATGGNIMDIEALLLGSTLYLWQMPHFFALSVMYRQDYARGGFAMLPVVEPDGEKTARIILRNAIYLSAVPFVATYAGVTSSMFAMEGLALNAYALHVAHKFYRERTNANARKIFLTSLWYLPSFMVLFLLHSKVWDEEENTQKNDFVREFISDLVHKIREAGRSVCVHERAINPNLLEASKQACPVALGSIKGKEGLDAVAVKATEVTSTANELAQQQQVSPET